MDSVDPVPVPQPEEGDSSLESNPRAVKAVPGVRPRITHEDFKTITAKLRYDLTAAQAKLTELMRMVAALELPEETQSFNERTALSFVRNAGHEYPDTSLADELALRGADAAFIDRALMLAAEVRRKNAEKYPDEPVSE